MPVSLRVSNSSSVGGNAGFHWIILVNSDTNETIKTTKASNVNGAYKFTFDKVPAGNYLVFAGTDSDNDGFICDPGEACGSYTTLNQPTIITVDKDDVSGINFITGFSLNLGLATTSKHVVPNQGFLRYDKNVK